MSGKEKAKIGPFTSEEIEQLERARETFDERKWQLEEILIRHNLLEKIQKHEDVFSCALCGKPFRDSDSRNMDIGKPIHSSCLIALLRRSSHE